MEAKQSSKTIVKRIHTKVAFDDAEVPDFGLLCYAWRWTFSLAFGNTLPLSFMEMLGLKYQRKIADTTAHAIGFAVKYLKTVK